MQRLLADAIARDPVPDRGQKIADRPLDRPAAGALAIAAEAFEAGEQSLDLLLILGKVGAALFGRGKRLARPALARFLDQAHVLEHGECRIDDPRARRIDAVRQFLDRADQIVAVAWLVSDELEKDQAKLAGVEHPAAPPVARPAAPIAPVTAAEAVTTAPAMPAAAHAHGEDRLGELEPARPATAAIHPESHAHPGLLSLR